VRTVVMGETKRNSVYSMIQMELAKPSGFYCLSSGGAIGNLDLKDATNMAAFAERYFPSLSGCLIHVNERKEKDTVMQEFLENKISILVSTTVIEVGIDVPRASSWLLNMPSASVFRNCINCGDVLVAEILRHTVFCLLI